jgi:hypothetical protein
MTINTKRKTDSKENTNGRCGKKRKKVSGKRLQTTILNGNILSQIQNNNLSKNPFYLKMTQIFKHFKWI